MLFTSFDYALLLAGTFCAYWYLPARYARFVLFTASVVFYAYWSVAYLALLGLSISIAYISGRIMEVARSHAPGDSSFRTTPIFLVVAVTVLLALLAYFKYANFLLDLLADITGRPHKVLDIVLPLGISFYTFQLVGYVVDVHRGAPVECSFTRFALFPMFFPHLIAGPIVRANELLPQLRARASFDASRTLNGLQLLTYGLVKKTVFADNLAVLVDRVYNDPMASGGLDIIIATLAFGVQIFCDFSGYTDIARGSSRLLGIELPVNFNSPYLATSFSDFWRRWHMTLSRWLRDYLYISLGGNRASQPRVYTNLFITMALGGLWHGASLTFLLWGVYHGLLLIGERVLKPQPSVAQPARTGGHPFAILITFLAVQIGWAIFRAKDYATLVALVSRLTADPLGSDPLLNAPAYLPLIVAFYVLHTMSALVRSRRWPQMALSRPVVAAPWLATAIALIVVFGGSSAAFIYFQF